MVIEIRCSACGSPLRVDGKLAGQQSKCPQCGALFTIPSSGNPKNGLRAVALSQATPEDLIEELSHRGRSAVLTIFDTPESGEYDLRALAAAKVRVYSTNEMDDAKTLRVLANLGRIAQSKDQTKTQTNSEQAAPQVFELKGDPLGMTLAEFKRKHARKLGGIGVSLPWCSSDSPGQFIPALQAEPWHAECDIVHARLDLPAENNSPTVAGVKTELLLYQFIDERLFRMTAFFDTDSFHVVREAVTEKHGKPTEESLDPMMFLWDNGVSSIHLIRGAIRPKKPSRLIYMHNQLEKQAEQRVPNVSTDL